MKVMVGVSRRLYDKECRKIGRIELDHLGFEILEIFNLLLL
jgi:hypothetical protein